MLPKGTGYSSYETSKVEVICPEMSFQNPHYMLDSWYIVKENEDYC